MLDQQPFWRRLKGARRVLLAGCGGGYEVLGALPLLGALGRSGVEVHLASLSFARLDHLPEARAVPEVSALYEVGAASARPEVYCPEAWFWYFDLPTVARTSLLAPLVGDAETTWDAAVRIEAFRKGIMVRERSRIPI